MRAKMGCLSAGAHYCCQAVTFRFPHARYGIPSAILPLVLANSYWVPCAQAVEGQSVAIEEVVVTARRKEEGLQSVPLSVSAFTGQELTNRNYFDLTEAATAIPNVQFQSATSGNGIGDTPALFIRGIGQQDFVINADPSIGIYVDGVYLGRSLGSILDVVDLERVEVLRGPQGTLFGRNTIGGAISVVTRKPNTDQFELQTKLETGERDLSLVHLAANIPISDTIAARLSGFSRDQNGYVKALQYNSLKLGNDNRWGIRGALRFQPSERLTVDLARDMSQSSEAPGPQVALQLGTVAVDLDGGRPYRFDQESPSTLPASRRFNTAAPGVPGGFVTTNPELCSTPEGRTNSRECFGNAWIPDDPYATNAVWTDSNGDRITPSQDLEVEGTSLTIKYSLDSANIEYIGSQRSLDAQYVNDLDYSPFVIFHNNNDLFEQSQVSHELKVDGSINDFPISYVAGLYYFEEDGTQELAGVFPLLPPALAQDSFPRLQVAVRDIKNTSEAAFAQLTWDASDRLHFTLGARYTEDEKTFNTTIRRDTGNEQASGDFSISQTNYLVSGSFDVTSDVMVYATYSDGFKDGGFPARFPQGLVTPLPFFDEETVASYELGVKSTWFDRRLRFNASAFVQFFNDIQAAFLIPGLEATSVTNVGDAEFFGAEVELNAQITDNFRVDLGLGYLDAELTDIRGPTGILEGGGGGAQFVVSEDNELPYTPEWNWNLAAGYTLPLGSFGEVIARAEWQYTDDQYFHLENLESGFQEAVSIVNMSLTYRPSAEGSWELYAGVKNLTDEVWYTGTQLSTTTAAASNSIAMPQTAFLGINMTFR